jgi:hypothetical protein
MTGHSRLNLIGSSSLVVWVTRWLRFAEATEDQMNPNIYFDWNTDNPSQTRIEKARCKLCGWMLEFPYPLYKEPWIERFKEDAYKHICQAKSAQTDRPLPRPKMSTTTSDRGYKTMSKSIPSAAGKVRKPPKRKRYQKTGRKR